MQYLVAWDAYIAEWFWDGARQRRGSIPFGDWWTGRRSRTLPRCGSVVSLSWIMVRRIGLRRPWCGCGSGTKRINLVHHPVHASWLGAVEICLTIQRKVLAPNDYRDFGRHSPASGGAYEDLSNRTPDPFAWKFTRQDLPDWLQRASPHFFSSVGCLTSKTRLTRDVICETDHLVE